MLPNYSVAEAAALAERVRATIEALKPFGGVVKVTTSIGIAASDNKGPADAEKLVKAADEAMYVAKWSTKNRVCSWPPNEAESAEAKANRSRGIAPK